MSNTAEVTPYADSGSSTLGSSLATGAALGVGAGLVMAGAAALIGMYLATDYLLANLPRLTEHRS